MLPPMNSIRAFEAAARHLSFQSAAEELGVTPSALSYQIRQLEDFLQLPLFVRTHRAVSLTKHGLVIAPLIGEGFEKLNAAFAALRQKDENKLIVTTGPSFSAKWLAPRLHGFIELYPDVDLRIQASLKLVDFAQEEVDIAIRFGAGDYPGLYSEKLFDEVMVPLISPSFHRSLGGMSDESLFEKVRLLHDESSTFISNSKGWKDWLAGMGYENVDPSRGSRFSHADHGIEAAIDGAGIVLARLDLAFRDIKAGRLIAPFDLVLDTGVGFYLCLLESTMDEPNIQHFVSWLRDEAYDQSIAMSEFLKTKRVI